MTATYSPDFRESNRYQTNPISHRVISANVVHFKQKCELNIDIDVLNTDKGKSSKEIREIGEISEKIFFVGKSLFQIENGMEIDKKYAQGILFTSWKISEYILSN